MNKKGNIRIAVDISMTVGLLFLMGYHLWGRAFHEWAGIAVFVLYIAHHVLNRNWHKSLFKGKYNAIRGLTLAVDALVFVSMLFQMFSAVAISRHVFAFLPHIGHMALFRRLHMLGAYWGFVLMSLHLGLHWNMILGLSRKAVGIKDKSKNRRAVLFILGSAVSAYGLWAFIKRDFLTYMFLKTEFVFLDFNESKLLFYIDCLAIMGLCIFIAHYGTKLLRKGRGRKKKEE